MFLFNPEALIDERARCGLTQKELADKAGVSVNIISRYERGAVSPRPRTAFKLAEVLGLERKDLYSDNKAEVAA